MALVTRFGLQIPSFTYPPDTSGLFEQVASIATTAESSGFDSVWVMDHFFQIPMVGDRDEPMFEAYTLLGGLAARTTRARLGAMVTGVTYRNPALLAKEVTAIDVLSGGRAVLGIGAAWFDDEHQSLGFAFPPVVGALRPAGRSAADLPAHVHRGIARASRASYYQIHNAVNRPRPIHGAGPPILVGGSGERRTLKLVARYADACNIFGNADTVRHKLDVLDAPLRRRGTGPGHHHQDPVGHLGHRRDRGQGGEAVGGVPHQAARSPTRW